MAAIVPSAHLIDVLKGVAKRQGFVKPRYTFSTVTKPGDNYVGQLYRVHLSDEDGHAEALSVIVKTMPMSPKRRELMQSQGYFRNETIVYTEILPALGAVLQGKAAAVGSTSAQFPYTPRCYTVHKDDSNEEERISTFVLEDMGRQGYVMLDRRKTMDAEQIRLVLRALAELHAASFAMEQRQPERFAQAVAGLTERLFSLQNPIRDSLDKLGRNAIEYIKDRFPEGSVGFEKAKGMLNNVILSIRDTLKPDPDGGNSFMHGDCWTNNLLFKFDQSGKPDAVCLLDFQMSRYGPPVVDLVYLIFVCTARPLRQLHYQSLLLEYHAHLSATLDRLLGETGSASRLYSWDTMQRQLRGSGRFGFGIAAMFLPLFLEDAEELPDPDSCFEEGGSDAEELLAVNAVNPERDERISDVLQDMLDLGYM